MNRDWSRMTSIRRSPRPVCCEDASASCVEPLLDGVDDRDGVRAGLLLDDQQHGVLAVEPADRPRLLDRVVGRRRGR